MARITPEERLTMDCYESFCLKYKTDLRKQFIHIANERDTKVIKTRKGFVSPRGAMFKRMGVRKGVLDIFIPSITEVEYNGLWVELKIQKLKATNPGKTTMDRNYPSKSQKAWLRYFYRNNYAVAVAWTTQEFLDYTSTFYSGGTVRCPYIENTMLPNMEKAERKGIENYDTYLQHG